LNTLDRFSNRVDNYIKYRPGYPAELFSFLIKEKILKSDSVIADIGSGTGISAKPFLDNGNVVFAVEPNKEMREAAERIIGSSRNFKSIDGKAESTGLKAGSIDILIAAQSFHWFDRELFRKEAMRVLKPEGFIVIVWNDRLIDETEFLMEYENLLHNFSIDYEIVNHKNLAAKDIRNYFLGFVDNKSFKEASFKNYQEFDFQGLQGRLLSSSYVPTAEHENFEPMNMELQRIYSVHNKEGFVRFEYDTIVYSGKIK